MGLLLLLIYSALAPAIALLYAVFFFLSPRRALMKSLGGELGERLALAPAPAGERPLWAHAASVGEVKAVVQLAPELAGALKAPLLITTSTASGRAEAAGLTPHARLAPLDFYPLAARFIGRLRPRMLVLVETEIWPATLYAAARAGVPVFMVNARISGSTAALYRGLGPLSRLAFSGVKQVLAQTEADAARFRSLPGLAGKVTVTGNLKYDQLGASAAGRDKVKEFLDASDWGNSPVFTAGSTHPEEEPVVISAWLAARKNIPSLKLIMVPRHPEKLSEAEAVLKSRGIAFMRWSATVVPHETDCLLVDAMGLLQAFYAVSSVCFVGGTLDNTGGHNVLEPALFAKPALFGPNYANARNAGDALIKEKGGFLVETAPQMAEVLSRLLTDSKALLVAKGNACKTLTALKGATRKTIDALTAHTLR
ncbi:MAG TPA: glycosyltransferase N-terminal domain-containing protein [Elusimicrobiales bacterium]|nr:glycosyltransferase N-terminal domain-containing protein [Elusimicrobiales bacterium]